MTVLAPQCPETCLACIGTWRVCLRCGSALPGRQSTGRRRRYCSDACRRAGNRLAKAKGASWWRSQPWFTPWHQERQREAAERERQREQERRQAQEQAALRAAMPPDVRAGLEAAEREASRRTRLALDDAMVAMDVAALNQQHARYLAQTGQQVRVTDGTARVEKLLWAAARAPGDDEAAALLAKARALCAAGSTEHMPAPALEVAARAVRKFIGATP